MEAVATAVGIASLGIQICQGLLSYYDDWKDYDSDISSTYDAITDLSKTLAVLKSTLGRGNVDKERAERVTTCMKSCEDALVDLEKKRQGLQQNSSPERTRERVRSTLQRSWYPLKKTTLGKVKANVFEVQERLKLALQVLQLDNDTEAQRLLLGLRRKQIAQETSLAQISAQGQRIIDAQRSEEFQKVVAWLSAADPWTNHNSARQRHDKQTSSWLLQSAEYRKWKLSKDSQLWMHGKAGCGKSVLCSVVIEDVKAYCQHTPDTEYAFFYFSFSDEQKQSDGDLLRSLVAQLGWREPGLSMLRQAYAKPTCSVPQLDELEKILFASITSCEQVFLVLDALDECPEACDVRQHVLERVERLTRHTSNLKVFMTSRELAVVRDSMEAIGAESLRIGTSVVDADIRIYLLNKLLDDRTFRRFAPTTLDLIETTITQRADGMFRWAYCQLQELKKLKSTTPKYVKQALDTLPTSLDETYARILLGIEPMYHEHALTLLRWLAYARSPPTLCELAEAAITDPTHEGCIDVENRGGLQDALSILSGLITTESIKTITEENDSKVESSMSPVASLNGNDEHAELHDQNLSPDTRVRLAHFSVKEYLESHRILQSNAKHFHLHHAREHSFLARSCLTYMAYYTSSGAKALNRTDFETFPLLKYAAESWYYHSALRRDRDDRHEAQFLHSESAKQDWLLVHTPDETWRSPFDPSGRSGSSIYYAGFLGLQDVVGELMSDGHDVNAQGGYFGNALQAASKAGHAKIVQLLLDHNANANAQGGDFGNALQAASYGGYIEVVRLLLEKGADVNFQGGYFGSALQAASLRGHVEVVHLLLDRDADVNAQGGLFSNALQAASEGGRAEVVRLLLDKGADVCSNGGEFGNPLYGASLNGTPEVVQLLLDRGTDVNVQGGQFGNALQAASEGGHAEVAQLLLNEGADVNARGGKYGNALQAASGRGHAGVVQLLVNRGADVNARGGWYGNALQAASEGSHLELVHWLLDSGADVNAQVGDQSGNLQIALTCDATEPRQLPLKMRTDANLKSGQYGDGFQAT